MKATITSRPPPPAKITLTMSERDARILTALIKVITTSELERQLRENISDVNDILPADFAIETLIDDDIGYRFYREMSVVLEKLNR
jgi:hypothetical protein